MRRLSQIFFCLVLILGGFWFGGRHEAQSLALSSVSPDATASERGAAAFAGADFGGLSIDALQTHAVPWRLSAAALVLDAQSREPDLPSDLDTLANVSSRFGFLMPEVVENLPLVEDRDEGKDLALQREPNQIVGRSVGSVSGDPIRPCAKAFFCPDQAAVFQQNQPIPPRCRIAVKRPANAKSRHSRPLGRPQADVSHFISMLRSQPAFQTFAATARP